MKIKNITKHVYASQTSDVIQGFIVEVKVIVRFLCEPGMSLSVKWIKEEHPFLLFEILTLFMSFHSVNKDYHGIFTRHNLRNFDIL